MKKKITAMTILIPALAAFALAALLADVALSKDYGNILRRKQEGTLPEQQEKKTELEEYEKDYDTTLRIYLTSAKDVYKPGETPVVDVYVKNEDNKTRFFKNVWTSSGSNGVWMKTIFDGMENRGASFFSRETVLPESPDPDQALRLDPGQQAKIMSIKFNETPEGEHTLEIEYRANYTVTEKNPRSWWNGLSRSNKLTITTERVIPEAELSASASAVIKKIHAEIMKLKSGYPEIAGYTDASMGNPAGAHLGAPVIDFSIVAPQRRRINVYFQKPDFQPNTLATYEEQFPYLGIKLFAHLETGDNTRLRAAIIDIIKRARTNLYDTTKAIAKNMKVQIDPFGPEMSKKLRRASYIVYGTVVSKKIEAVNPHDDDYQIRKWVLDVAVKNVYLGDIKEQAIIIKSGPLTTFFGNEQVENSRFIFLLGAKNNWQKEYTLLGVEPARDNLLQWLDVKY